MTMKKEFKFSSIIIAVFALAITMIGCGGGDEPPIAQNTLAISGISPSDGPAGTDVSITGTGFGDDLSKVSVFFNNVEGSVNSVNDTRIGATVPVGASTGPTKVVVDGVEKTGPVFTFVEEVAVTISSISPTSGAAGTQVTVTGTGFGTNVSLVQVLFNGIVGELVSVTDAQIIVTAPAGATTGLIKVVVDGVEKEGPTFSYETAPAPTEVVSTLAGSGIEGDADGAGTAAQFNFPSGVAAEASGNVYVADRDNHKIKKITPDGVVSTLAGSGTFGDVDGTGTDAQFFGPEGVAVDTDGNVYVADKNNHKIRKITPAGAVSTLAGSGTLGSNEGIGTAAQFNEPQGVAVDTDGNVYVADYGGHKIRKITPDGVVSTLAGSGTQGEADGSGTAAQFRSPQDVAVDASGNVYVADLVNEKIRKITPDGVVSTLAGSGTRGAVEGVGTAAQFDGPAGVAVDASGNVYVAETRNTKIRKITPAGAVSTLAGSGARGAAEGVGTAAQFDRPQGVAVDTNGNVYVADFFNHKIRKITQD